MLTKETERNENSQTGTDGTITGIRLTISSYNLIQSNTLAVTAPAISIGDESNYNQIIENTFSAERGSFGVSLHDSYFNTISDNVLDNFGTGLQLGGAENNTISWNIVTSRERALQLSRFNNNTFQGNQFRGATEIWDLGAEYGNPSINIWK